MIKTDPDRPAGPITGVPEDMRPVKQDGTEWYNLDRYSVYRDLLLLVGFILVVAGTALYSIRIATMLAGLGLMTAAYFMSK